MAFLVLYGRVVVDKELGIYIDGVYYGGIAECSADADTLARSCSSAIRGCTVAPKILPYDGGDLTTAFCEGRRRFDRLEREMVEAELLDEANKRRRPFGRKICHPSRS